VAILVTVLGWLAFLVATLRNAFFGDDFSVRYALHSLLYISVVTVLAASAFAYLLARLGFLYRTRRHHRVPRATLDTFFETEIPTVTVLVPSYREEPAVIRQTLLSAALQEYPEVRIALLIDDPPDPAEECDRELLDAARALPAQITELLRLPGRRFASALATFEATAGFDAPISGDELLALADHYEAAATCLGEMSGSPNPNDHSAEFVRSDVLLPLAGQFAEVASALRRAASENASLSRERMLQLYRRLAWTFSAEVTSFERKRYLSLSHEPNKAMNLNSYIGLMGGRYREHRTGRGPVLAPAAGEACDLDVPDTDYVLTLDADSVLLPEYCLRLVYLLEQPEFDRVAVAQTPYSAFPGAATRIERIAGATTDIQHMIHQGLTHYGATFWVGANAVLRKRALDDIAETEIVAGHLVRRFIQDRTVIEDTESSLDLAIKGWTLYNYPERLSYSATPPDFGSLCIQRQRWANGGLLILGKLWRYVAARRARRERSRGLAELFLRTNYLASITWASLGLVVLLAFPLDGSLLTPIALATALPYFAAMASDLRLCGYKRTDALRIYGFNLILLPVNVAGSVKSIGQAIGGQKIAFARTPKVRNRTTAPITFVLLPYLIIAFSLLTIWHDVQEEHYAHAAYAGVNAALCTYALVAFIGIRHSIVDIWLNCVERLYRATDEAAEPADEDLDWVAVLYGGAPEGSYAVPVPTPAAVAAFANAEDPLVSAVGRRVEPGQGVRGEAGRERELSDRADVADVLSHYLREVRERGRVVLHLDGTAVELVLNPQPGD
jgi:cellulose synthase/poly-beta-1,6-N-acetylglucosamine synthase-like glycosyltransferase